eukprot:2582958-Heterocapsa_arctica.AAC.1
MALAEEVFKVSKPAIVLCPVRLYESYGWPTGLWALRRVPEVAPFLRGEGLVWRWNIDLLAETNM